jgi:molybdopterin synthase catalytic subunit
LVRLQAERIRGADLLSAVGSDEDGAIVLFLGTVRLHNRGREVIHLEYEAYPAMAESEMARIVNQARRRYAVSEMALVHRTGTLKIGEVAVGVAVAAPHRAAALEACGFAIEELKRTVPIWKKEVFQGGEVWIEDQPKSSSSRSSSSMPK